MRIYEIFNQTMCGVESWKLRECGLGAWCAPFDGHDNARKRPA